MTTAVLQFSGTQPLRGERLTISVMEGANTSRQDFTSHVGTGSNRRGALEDSRTILHTSSMDSEEKFSRFSFGVTGASRGSSKLKTLNFYFFFPSPRSVTNTGCKKYLTLKPYVLRKKLKSKMKKTVSEFRSNIKKVVINYKFTLQTRFNLPARIWQITFVTFQSLLVVISFSVFQKLYEVFAFKFPIVISQCSMEKNFIYLTTLNQSKTTIRNEQLIDMEILRVLT